MIWKFWSYDREDASNVLELFAMLVNIKIPEEKVLGGNIRRLYDNLLGHQENVFIELVKPTAKNIFFDFREAMKSYPYKDVKTVRINFRK